MKNKTFVIVTLIVVGIIAGVFWMIPKPQSSFPGTNESATTAIDPKLWVRPYSMTYGKQDSKVTVVEFFDPQCESCRIMYPLTKFLISQYGDRVRFVHKIMPYHNGSILVACALEEAREFNKYDQALDLFFERQPIWGDHANPRPELTLSYLEELGIPKDRLDPDYLLKKHEHKIKQDQADGLAVGVTGTPEFYINGQMLPQLNENLLHEMIEEALKNNGS